VVGIHIAHGDDIAETRVIVRVAGAHASQADATDLESIR
jgi:hypothetical protein